MSPSMASRPTRSASTDVTPTPPLAAMTEEELSEMRERLVLEATARVLEAIETGPRNQPR